MKKHSTYFLLMLSVLVLLATTTTAQQATPAASPTATTTTSGSPVTETPDGMGDYNVIGSLEFGYRGLSVDGDHNKYQSDLNYKAGPRIFDSSFLMRSKDGDGGLFVQLLVTSTGWGADPQGEFRVNAEMPKR